MWATDSKDKAGISINNKRIQYETFFECICVFMYKKEMYLLNLGKLAFSLIYAESQKNNTRLYLYYVGECLFYRVNILDTNKLET